ncbi:MAG TPA: alpha/beta fold hydrolase [Candidatus Polarisedimenticolaceae bacterium]|nr:alpha/beta fold hydrolase [Candidatus Polarisedimenticolaceae bacterium]
MSDAKTITIAGPAGKLEAAVRTAETPRAVAVIAHPHPLYGGTLHNPVIFHTDRELNRAGLTTVRFNFRGVGASEGFHDDGRGEVGDVAAVAEYARGSAPSAPLVLVGYSFGSRCVVDYALHGGGDVAAIVAIGLPLRIWKFGDLEEWHRPFGVVQGTQDEFGSIDEVRARIAKMTPPGRLYAVEGAPHLFPGRAPEAAAKVVQAVEDTLSAS